MPSLDLPERADWFVDDHALPHPNWSLVKGWQRAYVPRANTTEFYNAFVRRWLEVLTKSLPEAYTQAESENFHFLSNLDQKARDRMLQFLEQAYGQIRKVMGDTSQREWHGKHLVMRFADADTYYRYIAHYDRDGEHATSGGCFLTSHYLHIVYPASWAMEVERRVIAHELTHNLLADLPVPRWLNEALAMAFEADVAGSGHSQLTSELVDRHHEYWTPETIQHFWMGSCFNTVKGQELSYSLSRVLLGLIHSDIRPTHEEFRRFVLASDWNDAGAAASREHLGVELGDIVAGFLGDLDWQPKPETWEELRARPEPEEDIGEGDEDMPAEFEHDVSPGEEDGE